MNLFTPAKKLKKVYFRIGEHPFVLLSIFIFAANKQNWNIQDITKVVEKAKQGDYHHLIRTLRMHASKEEL